MYLSVASGFVIDHGRCSAQELTLKERDFQPREDGN
jgi:hypothetical protein